ncbi:MAG: hypothetical protein PUB43_05350 [Oscillospiraceae bacterium]|nr:hypothetical protein [Oscillospiraceae bacterium]
MQSTLSFHMSEQMNEKHNLRTIYVPYVDTAKSKDNIYYFCQSKEEAFHELFDEAVEEYNAKQKRKDRKIQDYLKKIQKAEEKQKKLIAQKRSEGCSYKELAKYKKAKHSSYEIIVSLGNIQQNPEFAPGGEKADIVAAILDEYISGFQARNPNAYLYLGAIHNDEQGVIHAHLDIVFYSDFKTGLHRRVSLNKALEDMGYISDEKSENGQKKQLAVEKWQNAERDQLRKISLKHGIEIVCGNQSRQHLDREHYIIKKQQEEIKSKETSIKNCVTQIDNFLRYDPKGKEFYYRVELTKREKELERLKKEYEAVIKERITEEILEK